MPAEDGTWGDDRMQGTTTGPPPAGTGSAAGTGGPAAAFPAAGLTGLVLYATGPAALAGPASFAVITASIVAADTTFLGGAIVHAAVPAATDCATGQPGHLTQLVRGRQP